jgi:pimeloyl-ACP methyl ester carboxylesterase
MTNKGMLHQRFGGVAIFVGLMMSVLSTHAQTRICTDQRAKAPESGQEKGKAGSPIAFDRFGSLMFGGMVIRNHQGDTLHADQGYAQYFIPSKARSYPLVMWHGLGQSGKTWETTPDGRDGFLQIFTRRGWPVYVLDQPRRGRASTSAAIESKAADIPNLISEASTWETFRLGTWRPPAAPSFFPGVQVARNPASINQFFGQSTPNHGAEPFPDANHRQFMGHSIAQLLQKAGPSILLTHSHSGQYGWSAAMTAPQLVKAIVAYEPGEFAFPQDEVPAPIATSSKLLEGFMAPQLVPMAEFRKLTRIPILIVFGDNITDTPTENFGPELWRMARARAQQFVAAIRRHGGDARVLQLPEVGLCGNTHFPMSDLNNVEVANQLSAYLHSKGLDQRNQPYHGPKAN